MNHLKMIQQFLSEKRNFEELPDYGFPFVTISRQAGAGGHLLAYVILTEFLKYKEPGNVFDGWHVFDKDLCELVSRDPLLQNDIEGLVAKKYRSEFNRFMESLFTGRSDEHGLERTTFKVLRMLALIGKVILVGRGGSLVTADLPQGVHIRLVAPEAHRVVWMMKRFKMHKEDALAAVHKQDAGRKKLIKMFFQRDIDDPLIYDMVWNTGKVSLDIITRAAIDLVRKRSTPEGAKATLD